MGQRTMQGTERNTVMNNNEQKGLPLELRGLVKLVKGRTDQR